MKVMFFLYIARLRPADNQVFTNGSARPLRNYFHLNLPMLSKIVSLSIMHDHHRTLRIFNLQPRFILQNILRCITDV